MQLLGETDLGQKINETVTSAIDHDLRTYRQTATMVGPEYLDQPVKEENAAQQHLRNGNNRQNWISSLAKKRGRSSTTLEMPLPITNILLLPNLPPNLNPPLRTPREPSRTSKPHTLSRPHRSTRAPQHARPKSTRRHLDKPTSSQLACKRRDLRRQTHRHRTITVLRSSERRRRSSQISRIESKRRNSARRRDRSEAACSPGARRSAHVAWCPWGVGC
jgi:hypothetical protein